MLQNMIMRRILLSWNATTTISDAFKIRGLVNKKFFEWRNLKSWRKMQKREREKEGKKSWTTLSHYHQFNTPNNNDVFMSLSSRYVFRCFSISRRVQENQEKNVNRYNNDNYIFKQNCNINFKFTRDTSILDIQNGTFVFSDKMQFNIHRWAIYTQFQNENKSKKCKKRRRS